MDWVHDLRRKFEMTEFLTPWNDLLTFSVLVQAGSTCQGSGYYLQCLEEVREGNVVWKRSRGGNGDDWMADVHYSDQRWL
jgi:hypothetical protein